jgi:hypothetical protein
MDIARILTELREELQQVEDAIGSLERLALARNRRGRPPGRVKGRASTAMNRHARQQGDKNKPEGPAQTNNEA